MDFAGSKVLPTSFLELRMKTCLTLLIMVKMNLVFTEARLSFTAHKYKAVNVFELDDGKHVS